MKTAILLVIAISAILTASPAFAEGEFEVEGLLDFWWTLHEGNENGIVQESTQDPAADDVSGFNIKNGRLGFTYDDPERQLGGKFQLKLEEKVDLLDFYLHWYPQENLQLYFGQMKVPSTYEALSPNSELDFISRSTLNALLTDWSLSRTSYYSSFYGNRSYYRDAGIGVKGLFRDEDGRETFDYFFMIGNGLGHSLYIGGKESKEFIFSNEFGDYFYGLRLDWMPTENLTIGGHYSVNNHDNVLFNDEKTVFDLKRQSHSLDARYDCPAARFALMYGGGVIDDDFFHTGEKNLDYSGWEAKVFVPINDSIEAGLRYDNYSYTAHGSPLATDQNNWTLGLNYLLEPDIRVQFNYMAKDTNDGINPDLDDDILFVNFQYNFKSGDLLNGKDDDEDDDEVAETEKVVEEQAE